MSSERREGWSARPARRRVDYRDSEALSMDDHEDAYKVEDLFGGGNCRDALETLYRFLDGELTADKRRAIERHLEECSPCLRAFDFEAELKAVVARSCRDQVPENLRRRIVEALSEASKGELGSV